MRPIVALLLVAGCTQPVTDDLARREAETASGYCQQAIATVAELRKQGIAAPDVTALQRQLDGMSAEIAALKMQTQGKTKIPHLIVAVTGYDLGPWLGGNCSFNEKAGGETCFSPQRFYYASTDCTGDAYADETRQSTLLIGPNGDWFKAHDQAVIVATHSTIGYGAIQCSSYPPLGYPLTKMDDTGTPGQLLRVSDLAIALR